MRIRLAVLVGLGVCAVMEAAPPQFGELIEVNVVNVDVLVTDRQGRPVTDLRREDFEVLEDGKRVEVTNFRVVTDGAPPAAGGPRPEAPSRPAPAAAGPGPQLPPEERLHLIVYVDNFNLEPAHRGWGKMPSLNSGIRSLSGTDPTRPSAAACASS